MACAVCNASGEYPIIDNYGTTLYAIKCPECFGTGLSDEEAELADRMAVDQAKYAAAMRESAGMGVSHG